MKCQNWDTKKFEFFCGRIVIILGILFMGALSLYSLLYTFRFPQNGMEIPKEGQDAVLLTLVLMAGAVFLLSYAAKYLLRSEKSRKRNVRLLLGFTCAYAVVYGVVWAFESKYYMVWDQQFVSFWGNQLANGMQAVSSGDIAYLTALPHQLGIVAFMEQIYRLFGWENYHALQVINALAAGGIVFLGYQMIRLCTQREEPEVYYLLLMLGCHPLYIYATFVYSEVISTFFSFLAIYGLLKYLKQYQKSYVMLMAMAITAACIIRNNCYIVFIAIGCVLVVKAVSHKTIRPLLSLAVCILVFWSSHTALVHTYEQRIGYSLQEGTPAVLWAAMGLQEGPRAPGWYNGFVEQTDKSVEEAQKIGEEALVDSIRNFVEHPSYAAEFFRKKIFSQWSEPTYGCQRETNYRIEERSVWINRLYEGEAEKVFVQVMDVYQFLIYCGVLIFLAGMLRKKIPIEYLLLMIVILGGFFFHLFWEAKSRYAFPYFIMMLPMAAAGWIEYTARIRTWMDKKRNIKQGKDNFMEITHTTTK